MGAGDVRSSASHLAPRFARRAADGRALAVADLVEREREHACACAGGGRATVGRRWRIGVVGRRRGAAVVIGRGRGRVVVDIAVQPLLVGGRRQRNGALGLGALARGDAPGLTCDRGTRGGGIHQWKLWAFLHGKHAWVREGLEIK